MFTYAIVLALAHVCMAHRPQVRAVRVHHHDEERQLGRLPPRDPRRPSTIPFTDSPPNPAQILTLIRSWVDLANQYTNLHFQAYSLGLADQWPDIKRAYQVANRLLGDPPKVRPTLNAEQKKHTR